MGSREASMVFEGLGEAFLKKASASEWGGELDFIAVDLQPKKLFFGS